VTSVWLIRHGASTAARVFAIGATDPPLSDEGHAQAHRVAALMKGRPLVRILSSDRERALDTARMVAAPHGLPVEATDALRELDFGAWEGRSLGDLWSEEPAAAREWETDIRRTPASFGESVLDVERRVGALWDSLRPFGRDGGEIAIVAHAGSLAVLRSIITGETLSDAFAARLELGGAVALFAI
jgi:broad specificity phosphatase PhoE